MLCIDAVFIYLSAIIIYYKYVCADKIIVIVNTCLIWPIAEAFSNQHCFDINSNMSDGNIILKIFFAVCDIKADLPFVQVKGDKY